MPAPERITVDDLLDLHERVIASPDGAAPGIRDAGALEAVTARPRGGFGGTAFYTTPFARASALMESVIQRHPFVDGNKRTGLLAAIFSLEEEGYEVRASQKELANVSVEVADHHLDVDGLAQWFRDRATPSGAS